MVEPTKVCSKCGRRKVWSDFYAKVKWEDGTMRQPQSRCKVCHGAAVRANREPQRRYDRKRYQRIRNDPVAWAERLEEMRFQYRGRRGVSRIANSVGHSTRLPAAPFVAWLRTLGSTPAEIGETVGMRGDRLGQLLHGRHAGVEIDTVDRACLAAGVRIDDVYPLSAEAA